MAAAARVSSTCRQNLNTAVYSLMRSLPFSPLVPSFSLVFSLPPAVRHFMISSDLLILLHLLLFPLSFSYKVLAFLGVSVFFIPFFCSLVPSVTSMLPLLLFFLFIPSLLPFLHEASSLACSLLYTRHFLLSAHSSHISCSPPDRNLLYTNDNLVLTADLA